MFELKCAFNLTCVFACVQYVGLILNYYNYVQYNNF